MTGHRRRFRDGPGDGVRVAFFPDWCLFFAIVPEVFSRERP
jgi:hypothetical protein